MWKNKRHERWPTRQKEFLVLSSPWIYVINSNRQRVEARPHTVRRHSWAGIYSEQSLLALDRQIYIEHVRNLKYLKVYSPHKSPLTSRWDWMKEG